MQKGIKVRLICIAVVALVFCLIGSKGAEAGWRIYKRVQIRNADKHTLRFDRHGDGAIRAWLILRSEKHGDVAAKRPPYKVDDGPVRDLEKAKGVKTHKTGRWIYWEIHDGTAAPDGSLLEFLNGKKVVFQFYASDGMIEETTFELEGVEEAIGELLK